MRTYDWTAQRQKKAYLALEDGTVLYGWSAGADIDRVGEAVFNTGMTGYEEILSDPSYTGQFVCLTAPEIGNYGVNDDDFESAKYHAAGLIVHNIHDPSNWRSTAPLRDALAEQGTPALAGIDTRALTMLLRSKGSLRAYMCTSGTIPPEEGIRRARAWEGITGQDYVRQVTCPAPYAWDPDNSKTNTFPYKDSLLPPADLRIVAFDFGIKYNILRCMRRAGFAVTVVPATTTAAEVLGMQADGVFLSNGPGDPADVRYVVSTVEQLLGRIPLMGICLGHQLLGLALGGTTYKLTFGHHGCNHPVKDVHAGSTLITSQNHNFALDASSLPQDKAEITHISLNDGSVEGLAARSVPAFSVQYHPEAAPGPHDASPVFSRFRSMIIDWQGAHA